MKGRWAKFKSILASDLRGDERAALLAVLLLTECPEMSEARFDGEDCGKLSLANLARVMGASRSRAVAAVRDLEEAGWLAVTRSEGRARQVNSYRVTVPSRWRNRTPNVGP